MKKTILGICCSIFAAYIIVSNASQSCLNAFAEGNSNNSGISKGITAAIMIGLFVISAVIAGFSAFRFKKKCRSDSSVQLHRDNNKK